MREAPHVLGIVLAGGEGKRLYPLTADRAKPAVPFGGAYRLIDFVLSNFVNARFLRICVLTQYKSHSLDRHISQNWRLSGLAGEYITPVPAQQRLGPRWYTGSADAIYPDRVTVVRDEHVHRRTRRQLECHTESATVAIQTHPASDGTGTQSDRIESPRSAPRCDGASHLGAPRSRAIYGLVHEGRGAEHASDARGIAPARSRPVEAGARRGGDG